MNKPLRFLLLQCLAVLAGCASLNPSPRAPETAVPANWATVTESAVKQDPLWWKNFGDPQLDGLIGLALTNNNDFAAAAIRVRRAQLQAGLIDTNRSPSVGAGANAGVAHSFDPPVTSRASGLSGVSVFELDLWGKLAGERDVAHWQAKATEADCQAFALSLVGAAARLYWQLAYLNQSLAFNADDIAYAEKTLGLVRTRHKAGAVSVLSVTQAELTLASQQALRTQLVQQRVETRHALAILLNRPPESVVPEATGLSNVLLPAVAAGLPAAMVANRPDLRAAELQLRSALANVDITRTSFYPTFSLTGSLGTASATLLNLLQNPVATLGVGLSLPFVQWNSTQLAIQVSKTHHEEAIVNYRQRLHAALAEVEGSLSARTQLLSEEEKLRLALDQVQRAEAIAQTRFKTGFTSIQPWIDSQVGVRSAQRALLQNRLNQLNNQVFLYKALGLGAGSDRLDCSHSMR